MVSSQARASGWVVPRNDRRPRKAWAKVSAVRSSAASASSTRRAQNSSTISDSRRYSSTKSSIASQRVAAPPRSVTAARCKFAAPGGHDAGVRSRRLEELFRDNAREVLAYALRRTDPATAEEVVAEVFAIAWRRLDRVPSDEPRLWLYAVARRVLANERRASRRRAALSSALRPLSRDRADEPGAGDSLLEALATLRPPDREVLMLVAWEGL